MGAPSGAADSPFGTPGTFNVSGAKGTYAVIAADFDGDTKPDLALANPGSDNVSVLKGDGNGGAASATNYPLGSGAAPEGLVAADFTGDSKLDLAIADHGAANVLVLAGIGDGSFATNAKVTAVAGTPRALAAADLNGDSKLDLVVADDSSPGSVAVLIGKGDGTFNAPTTLTPGTKPAAVALGDVGSATATSLVVANSGSATATLLPGNGDGSFATAANKVTQLVTGSGPLAVALGDLDSGKGKSDIAVANNGADNVSVFLHGDGGLATTATNVALGSGAKPFSLAISDLDGDGKKDLVVSDEGTKQVSVLAGNGDGSFASPTNIDPVSPPDATFLPGVLAVADLDGNGKLDVIVPNRNANETNNISILVAGGATTSTTSLSSATTVPASSRSDSSGSSSDSPTLAATGTWVEDYLLTATALVLLGLVLVRANRREAG